MLLAGALMLAGGLGLQAQTAKKGEKAADSLKALAKTVQTGEAQLTEVTSALDQLCNKPNKDLRKPYKAFEKAMKSLSNTAADARKRREGLQKNREAYLAAWDQEIAKIDQVEIRDRSEARRKQVEEELAKLSASASEVGAAYQKYEAQLVDIHTALGLDLTEAGVKSVAPIANEARKSAVTLRESIAALRQELQTLGVKMSAKAAK